MRQWVTYQAIKVLSTYKVDYILIINQNNQDYACREEGFPVFLHRKRS